MSQAPRQPVGGCPRCQPNPPARNAPRETERSPNGSHLPQWAANRRRTARRRARRLAAGVREICLGLGIGVVEPEEIDRLNIYHAALEAMRRAVVELGASCAPNHLLVDARRVPGVAIPQTSIVHGDANDASIAAASIVAKVYRDDLMVRLDRRYSGYGFAQHMGYGTSQHIEALRALGPSPVHRRSFAPVAEAARV